MHDELYNKLKKCLTTKKISHVCNVDIWKNYEEIQVTLKKEEELKRQDIDKVNTIYNSLEEKKASLHTWTETISKAEKRLELERSGQAHTTREQDGITCLSSPHLASACVQEKQRFKEEVDNLELLLKEMQNKEDLLEEMTIVEQNLLQLAAVKEHYDKIFLAEHEFQADQECETQATNSQTNYDESHNIQHTEFTFG